MKILSPQISHKTDVGGVKLDIQDENEVRKSYKKMIKEVKALLNKNYKFLFGESPYSSSLLRGYLLQPTLKKVWKDS